MRSQSTGLIDRTLCRSEARKKLILDSPHRHICCIVRIKDLRARMRDLRHRQSWAVAGKIMAKAKNDNDSNRKKAEAGVE